MSCIWHQVSANQPKTVWSEVGTGNRSPSMTEALNISLVLPTFEHADCHRQSFVQGESCC